MKNFYILLAAGLLFASCGPTTVIHRDSYQPAPQPVPVQELSYQSFYDQLSPYGNWVNYPGYGYVWMPNAGPDFRPYSTNGNWIYTDAGWTWASNYNWGWAPFHYGRWFYENGYGWMWVPGNEWAPAWVCWRGGGDYYGWAPLGPRIAVDVALNNYNPPMNYWNFVPRRYMGNPGWHNYYVHESRNVTIINNTTIINNYSGTNRTRYAYAPGPDPNEVRRVSGNNFTAVQIREANAPGERISGNQYAIYQPRVTATPAARGDMAGRPATPAPARYQSFSSMRPSTQYPDNNQQNNNAQAVNNPRTATQNPNSNQPVNNVQPANNPRPATQNPNNNQPVNTVQPANNPRPVTPNPNSNQPVNNVQPANNPRPATQNPNNNLPVNSTQPAQANQPVAHVTDNRIKHFHPEPANANPQQPGNTNREHPATTRNQTTGRPVTTHNPNTASPVQRTAVNDNKPSDKPVERPKTREADSQ